MTSKDVIYGSFIHEITFTDYEGPSFTLSIWMDFDEQGNMFYMEQSIEFPPSLEFRMDCMDDDVSVIDLLSKRD